MLAPPRSPAACEICFYRVFARTGKPWNYRRLIHKFEPPFLQRGANGKAFKSPSLRDLDSRAALTTGTEDGELRCQ